MTQEEIYIKLIQGRRVPPEEISKEFLRDFQFCRAALEKIGIGLFSEEQQREMNLQAVEFYFLSSKRIFLEYDIPEIARLVPENISGSLELWQSKVKELPQLKSVGGLLDLRNSQIRELPQLKSAGEFLNLENSQIRELPQLEGVGGSLNLRNSQIRELPQLEGVGGSLNLENSQIKELLQLKSVGWHLDLYKSQIRELPQLKLVKSEIFVNKKDLRYWKDYFTQTNRPHLAEKVVYC